jgi:uncharacterized membrane protein
MEITSVIHLAGTVIGIICALTSAFLMLNQKTDEQKLRRGHLARRIAPFTWFAFIILIISGIVLSINQPVNNVYILGVKHLLVIILLVDASFIHFRFFPRYFKQIGTPEFSKTYMTMRRVGTLSVFCWVIILVLSILIPHLPAS